MQCTKCAGPLPLEAIRLPHSAYTDVSSLAASPPPARCLSRCCLPRVLLLAGLMKKLTGVELAREIGCSPATLDDTFKAYNAAAAAGTDSWGKKYYNAVPFAYVRGRGRAGGWSRASPSSQSPERVCVPVCVCVCTCVYVCIKVCACVCAAQCFGGAC